MTNSRYNAHTERLFKHLYLLKVKDPFDLQCLNICYEFVNKKLPNFFRDMFEYNHELHASGGGGGRRGGGDGAVFRDVVTILMD